MSENKAPAVRPSGDAAVVVADVPVATLTPKQPG